MMTAAAKMTPRSPRPITIEQFARDLWEALREEIREQLAATVTDEEFNTRLPPWEKLSGRAQQDKITIARDELLAVLDRAGYQVRRKIKESADPSPDRLA
jgi:hypothetical protein